MTRINLLCQRVPRVGYRANRLQRSRDAAILRIMSLGCATEPPWYRGATIIVIGKKGHQHQQHHQQHQQHQHQYQHEQHQHQYQHEQHQHEQHSLVENCSI